MSSQEEASDNISMPDLIVNECLFGCEGCPAIWENSQTGHKIICKCDCGHIRPKKNVEKVMLEGARHGWETAGHQSKLGAFNQNWCTPMGVSTRFIHSRLIQTVGEDGQ
jgi:hypothetical protein